MNRILNAAATVAILAAAAAALLFLFHPGDPPATASQVPAYLAVSAPYHRWMLLLGFAEALALSVLLLRFSQTRNTITGFGLLAMGTGVWMLDGIHSVLEGFVFPALADPLLHAGLVDVAKAIYQSPAMGIVQTAGMVLSGAGVIAVTLAPRSTLPRYMIVRVTAAAALLGDVLVTTGMQTLFDAFILLFYATIAAAVTLLILESGRDIAPATDGFPSIAQTG